MNYVDDDEEIVDAADVAPEAVEDVTPPRVPLKPWEHYTLADDLLRQAGQIIGSVVASHSLLEVERARTLTMMAQAHSEQAAAGALLQQHYAARFTELWSPGSIATTSKEERDAELDAYPGTARRPAR